MPGEQKQPPSQPPVKPKEDQLAKKLASWKHEFVVHGVLRCTCNKSKCPVHDRD